MALERNDVLGALDNATRLVRDYITDSANADEAAGLAGILSRLIGARDQFENATNPVLLEDARARRGGR